MSAELGPVMYDHRVRWVALALVVVGAATATAGVWMPWAIAEVPLDGVDWKQPMVVSMSSWCWLATASVGVGLVFAMLVGTRRQYLPRSAALVTALFAAFGALLTMIALFVVRGPLQAGTGYVFATRKSYGFAHSYPDSHELHLSIGPWVQLFGFVVAAAGAWLLWAIAVGVARRAAAELARVDREQARRDGTTDWLPEVAEEPIPKL